MIPHIQVKATSLEEKNMLVVKAPESIQKQIEKMLEIIDKPNNNKELTIVKINYIPATDIANIIQNIIRYKNKTNPGISIGDNKTNKIIILESKENLKDFMDIILKLDTKPNQANPIFITKLKNANSTQLSNLLNQIK